MRRLRNFSGLAFVFLLVACSAVQSNISVPLSVIRPSQTATRLPPTSSPTNTRTPTYLPPPGSSLETVTPASGNSVSISNPDTLKFVFPTPGLAPRSAWRPPLYAVPWAITPYDHFYFARPIAADEVNWPLADYRYGATWPGRDDIVHTGIDIDAPLGTPVIAAAAGKVLWAGLGLLYGENAADDPYGLAVLIQHDFGFNGNHLDTVYAHMSEVNVVPGQQVTAGTRLGLVGETGFTTGPHLHFEVRVRELDYYTTRNPELWLAPPQGWGVLVGRLMNTMGTPLSGVNVTVKAKDNSNFWVVRSYANRSVIRSDPYYQENMVLSDLPAGDYQVSLTYQGGIYTTSVRIHPGLVSLITFQGGKQFKTEVSPTPSANFLLTSTPTSRP